jgi:protein TonB
MSQNTQPAWEDIVFEKRNKEYGAYSIRMHYSDNVLRGTLFVGLLVAMFIGSSQFRSVVIKGIPAPIDIGGGIILPPPPLIEPTEVQQQVKQVVKKGVVKDVYKVTTQTVVDLPNPPDEVIAGATNDVETPGPEVLTSAVGGESDDEDVAIGPPVNTPYTVVEIMPTFEGGLSELSRYLQRRLRYPSSARRQGVEGTVFVSFVINGAGEVTDVQIMKGIYHDCDVEAARVVAAMPKWNAGKQHNRFVSVRMVLPIKFAMAP